MAVDHHQCTSMAVRWPSMAVSFTIAFFA